MKTTHKLLIYTDCLVPHTINIANADQFEHANDHTDECGGVPINQLEHVDATLKQSNDSVFKLLSFIMM